MRSPPKEKGPAVATPGHDRSSLVSTFDQDETYSEQAENARVRCLDCALFHSHGDSWGECRALPPRFVQNGLEAGAWPRISASNWCGAFMRDVGA